MVQEKRYRVRFLARELGAIGIRSWYVREVAGVDEEAARLKLYDRWEHIHVGDIEEVSA